VAGIDGAWTVPGREAAAGLAVMDPASTAVALAVGAEPGHRVLDVAAAPGNKTMALDAALGGRGLLVAADRNRRRVAVARRRLAATGVIGPWVVADGAHPPFRPGSFDRVLLDAPCTGLGTARRRPEIKFRLDAGAPDRMAALQRALVEGSLPLLRPGGRLVYSVCTVFAEETVAIASAFGGRPPDGLPGRAEGDGWLLAPHLTGTDGMFVTVIDG
jgi:16S rRNA (cytosine967-C5)-methyltransferase